LQSTHEPSKTVCIPPQLRRHRNRRVCSDGYRAKAEQLSQTPESAPFSFLVCTVHKQPFWTDWSFFF